MRKIGASFLVLSLSIAKVLAEGGEGGSEGGNSLMKTLGIDPAALVVQLIGFLLLVMLLNKFLFGPIKVLLSRRQQDIQETYDKIEADKREMELLKTDYEQRLATIEAQARERIQVAVNEAQSMKDNILNEARAQSELIRKDAEDAMAREHQRILIELRTQVADLALNAAERLIGVKLDDATDRKLVEEFIEHAEVTT
ncbi:MAG: F0F1 ATP synthase subunit B [bacterium]|jgi:F-type H+-transporting ATPase subunit b